MLQVKTRTGSDFMGRYGYLKNNILYIQITFLNVLLVFILQKYTCCNKKLIIL
jgi:hypothetical protein